MHFKKKLWYFLSILSTLLLVVLPISGCNSSFNVESTTETRTYTSTITNNSDKNTSDTSQSDNSSTASSKKKQIDETDDYLNKNGSYTSKEDVTNYLIQYRQLPTNFITKKEAKKLGWSGGSLEAYAPGKCMQKAAELNELSTQMTARFIIQMITMKLLLYFMGMIYNDNHNRWIIHKKERRFLCEHKN